tara:strand:- start:3505 stop:4074 length:570 start_codon:yes stop_codon:yes gene_type:complete
MILILFGPPGAGKGTQAAFIAEKFDIPHLSTGAILRNKLLEKDSLSIKLMETMNTGNLVSDEILNKIIADRLKSSDCNNGFILDGYPRTISQKDFLIDFLDSVNLFIDAIIDLKIDKKNIIERIKSRLKKENRDDDQKDIIMTRIEKYDKETKPLSDYFKKNYTKNYHTVNGNQDIEKIHKDILKLLEK